MYVCVCNGITDRQIRAAAARGVTSLQELQNELGVASQCGNCAEHALSMLVEAAPRRGFEGGFEESRFYSVA